MDKFVPRVVVKLRDERDDLKSVDEADDPEQALQTFPAWADFERRFGSLIVERLFGCVEPDTVRKLMALAVERDRTYRRRNLLRYFALQYPAGVDPAFVAKEALAWDAVDTAYVEGDACRPPRIMSGPQLQSVQQVYLHSASEGGIDARFAWDHGGDGTGVQFVDLEQGWFLNHEGLPKTITKISGEMTTDVMQLEHGTAVLSIVLAPHGTGWGDGITPKATGKVVSFLQPTRRTEEAVQNLPCAIASALDHMHPGDVLLLEAQTDPPGFISAGTHDLPVEVEQGVFDAICLGTALGIVVVEAAGNAGQPLDPVTIDGVQVLNRQVRDSLAIIVGAATSNLPHRKTKESNFGNRVDCYGWGQNIFAAWDPANGGNPATYTDAFDGTSGAAAIVAGAAIAVQAVAKAVQGVPLRPERLRGLFRDTELTTPSSSPGDQIGGMPNLCKIISRLRGLPLDACGPV